MEIAIVRVTKCYDEIYRSNVVTFVCETFEEGKNLLKAIREKYMEENPDVANDEDTRHVMEDTDTNFSVIDDYCYDAFFINVEMRRPVSHKAVLQELETYGMLW